MTKINPTATKNLHFQQKLIRNIVCVMPFAFHQEHNEGLNIAEIINFGTNKWIQYEKQL